ncbi:hypothetical protein GCM10027030_06780 [Luteococcus sediminum]
MTSLGQMRRSAGPLASAALLSALALAGCGSGPDTYAFADQCRIDVDRDAKIGAVHTQDSGFASDSSWVAQAGSQRCGAPGGACRQDAVESRDL